MWLRASWKESFLLSITHHFEGATKQFLCFDHQVDLVPLASLPAYRELPRLWANMGMSGDIAHTAHCPKKTLRKPENELFPSLLEYSQTSFV